MRSLFVIVPSISPPPSAGNLTWAKRAGSVWAIQSETTTSGQAASASRTSEASGIDTAGLVAMIHSALIRPSRTDRNRSTALSPGFAAIVGEDQKRCTSTRFSGAKSRCAASEEARSEENTSEHQQLM